MIRAIMTSPRNGRYGVTFYNPEGSEGPQDWTQPSYYLPCYSYEHAQAVTNAYNAGHVQPQPPARPVGEMKGLVTELENALKDLNAVRDDMNRYPKRYGPFLALLERAAVHAETVRIALRTG